MAYKNTCTTLAKVPDNEPIFVLRAQDESAPAMVMIWIACNKQISADKRREALECAETMREWKTKKKAD